MSHTSSSKRRVGLYLLIWLLWSLDPAQHFAQTELTSEPTASQQAELDQLLKKAKAAEAAEELNEAVDLYNQALALVRKVHGSAHQQLAEVMDSLCKVHQSRRDFQSAINLSDELIELQKKLHGESHWRVTDARLAREHYSKLAALPQNQLLTVVQAEVKAKKALALHREGKYAEAVELAKDVVTVRKAILGKSTLHHGRSLHNLARLYDAMGDYAHAEPLYLESQRLLKEVLGEKHPHYAASLNKLAILYYAMGDYARAEPLQLENRRLTQEVLGERDSHYAASLNNLANLYDAMGDYTRAAPLYLESQRLLKEVLGEKHPHYAASLHNLARIYYTMGDYVRAEPLYLESQRLWKEVLGEKHPHYALSLDNLANLYYVMGDYARAEPLYLESRHLRKEVLGEKHPDYARSLNNLGMLYDAMGDYTRAEPLYLKSQRLWKEVLGEEHPDYARSLNNLANLYYAMGDYARAEPLNLESRRLIKEVLGEKHPDYASSLHDLGVFYNAMGDYARAEPLTLLAHEAILHGTYNALPSLSEAQAMAWIRKNASSFDRALDSVRHSDAAVKESRGWALAWQAAGLLEFARNIPAVRLGRNPEVKEAYRELSQIQKRLALVATNTPDASQIGSYKRNLQELSDSKEQLEKRLASLSPEVADKLAVRDASVKQLVNELPKDVAVVTFIETTHWERVRHNTADDADGAAREVYDLVPEQVYDAFVLRPDAEEPEDHSIDWIQLGAAEAIDDAVAAWREDILYAAQLLDMRGPSVSSEPTKVRQSKSRRPVDILRGLTWAHIEPHLNGCSTVIVIPDGRLTAVAWAALPGKTPGTFLLEDYAISTAGYPQQIYAWLIRDRPQAEGITIAGGIDYDAATEKYVPTWVRPELDQAFATNSGTYRGSARIQRSGDRQQWSPLEGSAEESQAISQLYSEYVGGQLALLTGQQSGEVDAAALVRSSRYVHLATHGFFEKPEKQAVYKQDLRKVGLFDSEVTAGLPGATLAGRNPLLLSGLVFGGANLPPPIDDLGLPTGEDGILTAEEIVGLDLNDTDLVVLSACESALGELDSSSGGVFGLQKAFHRAGARTVIASLWSVDDQATQTLMVEFYRNLWEKKLGKLESLRQAQLTMLSRYHPASGKLREADSSRAPPDDPLPEYFWAAFTLSGDWR